MWGRGNTISPYQSQEGVAHLPEVAIHKLNITDTITPIIFFLVLVPSDQTFELTGAVGKTQNLVFKLMNLN